MVPALENIQFICEVLCIVHIYIFFAFFKKPKTHWASSLNVYLETTIWRNWIFNFFLCVAYKKTLVQFLFSFISIIQLHLTEIWYTLQTIFSCFHSIVMYYEKFILCLLRKSVCKATERWRDEGRGEGRTEMCDMRVPAPCEDGHCVLQTRTDENFKSRNFSLQKSWLSSSFHLTWSNVHISIVHNTKKNIFFCLLKAIWRSLHCFRNIQSLL